MNQERESAWLKQEGTLELSSNDAFAVRETRVRGDQGAAEPNLAIFLKPLVVLDTQKWFGEAELRLDALVVHGGDDKELYHPQTFRFPRVADGDDLAGDEKGLLIFLGKPRHFVSLSVMLSRDTKDSDDLAKLIQTGASSKGFTDAASAVASLSGVAAPQIAAMQTGITAALALGDLAYQLVRAVSPRSLGLYRASWLGAKDRFGIGRHPRTGSHLVKDFRVGCEIVVDRR